MELKPISELKVNPEYEKALHPLNEQQFQALKLSIKSDGILAPIIINKENVILDGHHRYKIAKELGIKELPTLVKSFENLVEELGFVLSVNYKRRHANSFQLAEIGMKLLEVEKKKAKERQLAGKRQDSPDGAKGKAVSIVAKQIGLSERTFERAKKIIEEAPKEIRKLCREEALEIYPAYKLVRAFEGIPKETKEKFTEKLVTGEMTPKEIIRIIEETKVVKAQLENEDPIVKETVEKILKDSYYTEDFNKEEAIWTIEEISKDPHRLVEKEFPIDRFSSFEEAQAWAEERNGVCLGKIERWLIKYDPVKDKKLSEKNEKEI